MCHALKSQTIYLFLLLVLLIHNLVDTFFVCINLTSYSLYRYKHESLHCNTNCRNIKTNCTNCTILRLHNLATQSRDCTTLAISKLLCIIRILKMHCVIPGLRKLLDHTGHLHNDLPIKTNTMLMKNFKNSRHGSFTLVHSTVQMFKMALPYI